MKHIINTIKRSGKPRGKNGFTIVETLFSLLLVTLALVFTCKLIVCAIEAHGKSKIRFSISQWLEYYKNQMLAKPYDAEGLQEGHYTKEEGPFAMKWDIKDISPIFKVVQYTISYKQIQRKTYFYISKSLKKSMEGGER